MFGGYISPGTGKNGTINTWAFKVMLGTHEALESLGAVYKEGGGKYGKTHKLQ